MSHPQPSIAQRQFSPPQATSPSPSNATGAGGFSAPPPAKRPKVSLAPQPSQPNSPYGNSTPYAASPTSGVVTPTATGVSSPLGNMAATTTTNATQQSQAPQGQYNLSHQPNGRPASMAPAQPSLVQSPTPTPSQPPAQPLHQSYPAIQSPHQILPPATNHSPHQYSHAQLALNHPNSMPTTSDMPPPTMHASNSFSAASDVAKQPARPAGSNKATAYEMNDMLMGTGIDLEEEAEYMNNLETRTGFPLLPSGGRDSFYGAGPANQSAEPIDEKSQEEYAVIAADRAWNEAAHRLAVTRSQEMRQHLLEPGILHKRMHEVAQKFGLGLNLDLKPDGRSQYMGKFAHPTEFPKPELRVVCSPDPDSTSATVRTLGSFIPKEAFLVDQIALLSIGTKERLRDLLGDANKIAGTRQKSSHGAVPTEWIDAAAPLSPKVNGTHAEGTRIGAESAVSPRTNPLKRPLDELNNGLPTPVSEVSTPNYLIESLLEIGKQSQSAEEGRLKKRQKRIEKLAEKDKEGAEAGSRSGSVAPGTPGSIAPDGGDGKSLSKKEGKKAAAKAAESSSGTTVNATLSLFTGGKKKKYSWMNSGAGSGASTPRPQSNSGAPSGAGGSAAKAGRGPLTRAGVQHLGQFREDSEKGKNIQLRDWIVVLEDRGLDPRSLQIAYDKVDRSDTGEKVATEKS